MERGVDICVEASKDSKFCVSDDRGILTNEKNERSLSLRVAVEQIREHLHQKMMPTAQGLVGEEMYIRRYTVRELVKGVEEGSLLRWNQRSVHEIRLAKYVRRNVLQRVESHLVPSLS